MVPPSLNSRSSLRSFVFIAAQQLICTEAFYAQNSCGVSFIGDVILTPLSTDSKSLYRTGLTAQKLFTDTYVVPKLGARLSLLARRLTDPHPSRPILRCRVGLGPVLDVDAVHGLPLWQAPRPRVSLHAGTFAIVPRCANDIQVLRHHRSFLHCHRRCLGRLLPLVLEGPSPGSELHLGCHLPLCPRDGPPLCLLR